jgi:hypothetical protein
MERAPRYAATRCGGSRAGPVSSRGLVTRRGPRPRRYRDDLHVAQRRFTLVDFAHDLVAGPHVKKTFLILHVVSDSYVGRPALHGKASPGSNDTQHGSRSGRSRAEPPRSRTGLPATMSLLFSSGRVCCRLKRYPNSGKRVSTCQKYWTYSARLVLFHPGAGGYICGLPKEFRRNSPLFFRKLTAL